MIMYPTNELLRAAGGRGPIRIYVESSDSKTGRFYEFPQPFVLVGRHERSDLWLANAAVGNRQLYLQIIRGRLFAVHLSDRVPTFWGTQAQPAGWVDSHTTLAFGPYRLRFPEAADSLSDASAHSFNPLAAASHAGPPVTLELQNSSSGKRLVLDRTLTLVGNASICKIRMNSSRVSSIHCSLVRTGGGLLIVDLGSREGVVVNDTATRAAILAPGDIADIGGRRLQMSYEVTDSPRPIDAAAPDHDDGLAFNPTELAGPRDHRSPPNSPSTSDAAEFLTALGPVIDRFSTHQSQTFDQFQEMMATMLRVFGTMFTEHREFVKDELARLDNLTRLLANERPGSAASVGPAPQPAQPKPAPDLSVPLPPLNSPPAAEEIHVWLQQRIGEMGHERASLLQKMAGMFRAKVPDSTPK